MNKQDLTEALTKVLGTQKEAKDAVEAVFREMRRAIVSGDKVVVSGFGSFHPYFTGAKKGRNPRTGETIQIAPRKKVQFRPSAGFFE